VYITDCTQSLIFFLWYLVLFEGVAFSQYPRCLSRPDRPGAISEGYLWNRECSLINNDDIYAFGYSIRVQGIHEKL